MAEDAETGGRGEEEGELSVIVDGVSFDWLSWLSGATLVVTKFLCERVFVVRFCLFKDVLPFKALSPRVRGKGKRYTRLERERSPSLLGQASESSAVVEFLKKVQNETFADTAVAF